MATVSHATSASPAKVFAALSNGWYYSNWVVGTSHMRAVDAAWPATGSKLHHASGAWPLLTRDETEVEKVLQDRRLVLSARGRPFGEARIVLELDAEGSGCTITITETPTAGPGKWLHNPATEALLARRNAEALARLAAIAEARSSPQD